MQQIRLDETDNTLIEIPFTSVSNTNLQNRLNGTTLPNASITVYVKKPGASTAIAGTGTFVTVDDTHASGVRGYRPAVADRALGVCTFIFTATGMEPREVPVAFVKNDPYAPAYYASTVAGTLTTSSFTTDRTEVTADAFKDALVEFLDGPCAGAVKPIGAYAGTGAVGTFTLKTGYTLPATPTAGNKVRIITR